MPSKKSRKKSLEKPRFIEIFSLLLILLTIIFISIVAIFHQPDFPIRLNFVVVETITIRDNWSGLAGSREIVYHLSFQDGALIGTGDFLFSRSLYTYQENDVQIEIPREVTQAFFNKLKQIELIEEPYKPHGQATNDNPSLAIIIDTRRENIELFSQSQGILHIPWGAFMRDTEYTIQSAIPTEALEILEPYLRKQEVIDNYIAYANNN